MTSTKKMKMIAKITTTLFATAMIVGLSMLDRRAYVGVAPLKDSTIAFEVKDPSFVKDTMYLYKKTHQNDTLLVLAQTIVANDTSILSLDTLTNIRLMKK